MSKIVKGITIQYKIKKQEQNCNIIANDNIEQLFKFKKIK